MRAPPGRVGSRAGPCVRGTTMCARVVDLLEWKVVWHLCPSPAACVCVSAVCGPLRDFVVSSMRRARV